MPSKNNFHRLESSFVAVVICQPIHSNWDFEYVPLPKLVLNVRCRKALSLHSIVIVNNKNYKSRSYSRAMVYDIIIKLWNNDI